MLKKTKFLLKEAKLRVSYKFMKDCLFCKIINGEIKSNIVFETDKVIAFPDINPVADAHILIVPKKHIDSVLTVSRDDGSDIVSMYEAARELVLKNKLESFRLAFNGGKYQHVPHLHMHLLSGKKIEWSRL